MFLPEAFQFWPVAFRTVVCVTWRFVCGVIPGLSKGRHFPCGYPVVPIPFDGRFSFPDGIVLVPLLRINEPRKWWPASEPLG